MLLLMGKFITDQILGMKWLNALIGHLLRALQVDTASRIGGSLQFFLYDVIKITVLLCVLIYLISYIQSYFPPERSRNIMGRFHGIRANCIAALLGTVTPFCSCSSIPLFIGFTSAGLPLGVTFSFLISSPMVDLGSLVLLMSIFGAKVAVLYLLLGLAGLVMMFVKKDRQAFTSEDWRDFAAVLIISALLAFYFLRDAAFNLSSMLLPEAMFLAGLVLVTWAVKAGRKV